MRRHQTIFVLKMRQHRIGLNRKIFLSWHCLAQTRFSRPLVPSDTATGDASQPPSNRGVFHVCHS
jgi:hypothetical protein